jgi:GcrA cell cycle regulator
MEWAEEMIFRLRSLWDEGLSTAAIALRMGLSKNSVIGKAHRLHLPARPSPIRLDGPQAPARIPRHRSPVGTLPQLPSARSPPAVPVALPASPPPPPPRPKRIHICCWPLGVPRTKSFRFCDADAKEGKPYCPDHCRLAFVRAAA